MNGTEKVGGVTGENLTSEQSEAEWKKREQIRTKPWADCSAEEKLEKLREEFMNQRYTTRRVHEMGETLSAIEKHTHGPNMEMVIPFEEVRRMKNNSLNGLPSMYDILA